jgi:HPt (histidine-containing phosphotransfer) domain-containing protein
MAVAAMGGNGDLDLAAAARLLGDEQLVPLVADAFASSAPALLQQLRQSVLADDQTEVRRHLHRLTPTLALLASQDLQDQCERVFALWRAPRTAEREARSLALVDRLDALAREATQWVNRSDQAAP